MCIILSKEYHIFYIKRFFNLFIKYIMNKLKNITVATEYNVGYYSILKESCKIHNIELITLNKIY